MSQIHTKVDHNFWLKVLSFLAAAALWFFVMNEQNPLGESSFSIPITVIDAPEGMKITLEEDTVNLKLRAPRSLFATADKGDMKVLASLAGMEEGMNNIKLHAIIPQGFELVGTSPDKVVVHMEPIIEKKFEISLIRAGNVAQGMAVASVTPQQRIITVRGPRSQVEKITRVIGYVGLSIDHKEDFVLNVPLTAVNADGKGVEGIKLSPSSVEVEVQLVKGLAKKTVDIKPIFDGTLHNGFIMGKVIVNPARLEVAGPADLMNNISVLYTEKISLDELTKSEKRKVRLILPEGISAATENVVVDVTVTAK